jgi:hypothetical protein
MSPRTDDILERVQCFSLYFAVAGAVVILAAFTLTVGIATGFDLIGWNWP